MIKKIISIIVLIFILFSNGYSYNSKFIRGLFVTTIGAIVYIDGNKTIIKKTSYVEDKLSIIYDLKENTFSYESNPVIRTREEKISKNEDKALVGLFVFATGIIMTMISDNINVDKDKIEVGYKF